jgi:UDP-3-O-[3-hydroxymyristoyl] glucosamine N-acyltransferase
MSYSLRALAELVRGRLDGPAELTIRGVAGLSEAGAGELSFLAQSRYRPQLATTRAAAVILTEGEVCPLPAIRVADPYAAFVRVLSLFAPQPGELFGPGVHPTAVIDPTAILGQDVRIGAHAVIDAHCRVGDRSIVGAGCILMVESRVGRECLLYPRVCIREHCELGDRVIVHAGAVIGSDGFGFTRRDGRNDKIPQIGRVLVGDDVEIGANSCIDRAMMGATVIGAGTKLDNLVQVAHNVSIGSNSIISAQSGISGSTKLGSGVVLGGQVGVAGHLSIGDRVQVAGKSGVAGDVPSDSVVAGMPAREVRAWRRIVAHEGRLSHYAEAIQALSRRLQELEKAHGAQTTENTQD